MKPLTLHQCSRWALQLLGPVLITGAILLSRFGVLPANFSPVGSLGFFGAGWQLLLVTLGFDALTGANYAGIWVTYLAFAGYFVFGQLARRRWSINHWRSLSVLPLASFWFFLISNLGVWWFWYPQTASGLLTCYVNALPFYPATLLSDVVFGGGWWWLRQHLPSWRQAISRLVYLKSL